MKVLALIVATLAVATFGNVCPLGYPGKFSCLNVTFKELVEAPLKFDGVSVCVKGVAASITGIPTYSEMHMTMEGLPYVITVKGETDMFTYPLDCVGSTAYVEGVFSVNKDDLFTMEITATAVTLSSDTTIICQEWNNKAVVHSMDSGDFYGPGMGSGLVVLNPGEMMHLHSTNHSTEIVTVVEGTINFVIMRGAEPEVHVLNKHDAILVPHSTPHYVANQGTESATYIFVHALVPVPAPEE